MTRPNIVLVITDQQRVDTIHALGAQHVDTPVLDRLVGEGTVFANTYVSAPSCAPSRASLFTGLFPHNAGVLRNDELWQHSWVERLAASGYHCVNVGKMHTHPLETPLGFHERTVVENKDRATPRLPFFHDQWDKALFVRGETKPDRSSLRDRPDYRERLGAFEWPLPEDLHADVFVGNQARWWLETYPGVEPFFLQIGFPGPHPPYDPVPRHLDAYRDRDVPAPIPAPSPDDEPAALSELRNNHLRVDHDCVVHRLDATPEQEDRRRRHYYANVTMIDEQIGLVVEALERRGVLDDTVLIVTSDHGDALGDHGHSQKWTMYEPSVHVPAVVWGRDVAAGRIHDGLTQMMDLGPTVLELAGVEVPDWFEAQSLVPALHGEPYTGREYVYSEHARDGLLSGTELMTMVRDERWKLVEFVDSDDGQLFDLADDPDERRNRWSDPDASTVKQRLQRAIATWRATGSLRARDRWREHR